MLDKAAEEPPPYTVLVHGPPGVSAPRWQGGECVRERGPRARGVWAGGVLARSPLTLPGTSALRNGVQVGKSTLIRCLIKHWTRQDVRDIKGPITVVAGKTRRLLGGGACMRGCAVAARLGTA